MFPLSSVLIALALSSDWDPHNGEWGRASPIDIRVMTYNVEDNINSEKFKVEGVNGWTALTMIVASMKPDVLILQEAGDTGQGVDSVDDLETTIDLFLHGGTDPFLGGAVTAYVQAYAPNYDLPYVFVSTNSDGFNRNVILSRFPFGDLNGDGKSTLSDMPPLLPDEYAIGGNGGIRGFQHAEIDLPDGLYIGDLVIGNSHLKAGGDSDDRSDRLRAAKNIVYFLEYLYNGAGTGTPDPNNKIIDSPPATDILDASTAIVIGGDWNEDEATNGRKGPAEWLAKAERADSSGGGDGPDKDRSDSRYDDAADVFDGNTDTRGSSKLDYACWQDSLTTARVEFIFNSGTVTPPSAMPPELDGFPIDARLASGFASDHLPVIVDLVLPTRGCSSTTKDMGGGGSPRFVSCNGIGLTWYLGDAPRGTVAVPVLLDDSDSLTPRRFLWHLAGVTDQHGHLEITIAAPPRDVMVSWVLFPRGSAPLWSNAVLVERSESPSR